ncbi:MULTISPECIES: phage tail assembly chaperone [unclassified Rhizobium]|uniref:phage tail assembly chaperone n=1 Tax=unclassified Rhizobium TaxID=2613769 RepID=UPI003802D50F
MAEFSVNGIKYRSGVMDAMTEFHVTRRLSPIIGSFRGMMDKKIEDGIGVIADVLAKMSNEDAEFIISSCMNVVEREEAGGRGWAKAWSPKAAKPMYDDITMAVMIQIVFAVLGTVIGPFFDALLSGLSGQLRALATKE